MLRLSAALAAWGGPGFKQALKQEVEGLGADSLPLQQGLSSGSYAQDEGLSAMVLSVAEAGPLIRAKLGLFYSGVIAGCNCADDPTPVDTSAEYCEVLLEIDKRSAETRVTLLPG